MRVLFLFFLFLSCYPLPHDGAAKVEALHSRGLLARGGAGGTGTELTGGLGSVLTGLFKRAFGLIEDIFGGSKAKGRSLGGSFAETFEKDFGEVHPTFCLKSFVEATDYARRKNMFCLVYISSSRGGSADEQLCQALADKKVAAFIDKNFVFWATHASCLGAADALRKVAAKPLSKKQPFFGVVHTSAKTGKRKTISLHHCNPPPHAPQLLGWMERLLEVNQSKLAADRAEREFIENEALIARERREGYARAIKDDKVRAVKEKAEEAARLAAEEAEQAAQAAAEEKEKADLERRAEKEASLGTEPEQGEDGVITIMLRLGDGSRQRRRFRAGESMAKVFDWADVLLVDLDSQQLASSMPKATYAYPDDAQVTLAEAGFKHQVLIYVEKRLQQEGKAAPAAAAEAQEEEV
ncbi:unnamed protein product [Chrysoparadoxa australica]